MFIDLARRGLLIAYFLLEEQEKQVTIIINIKISIFVFISDVIS